MPKYFKIIILILRQSLNPKNVRIPHHLYDLMAAEAEQTGIGQAAVMARKILIERIQQPDLEVLADILRRTKIQTPLDAPRITIRLSEGYM